MESLVKARLAIDGGKRVRTKSPILEQDVFDQEELQALAEVAKQKNFTGRKQQWLMQAIVVLSETTSLHIALAAFGIGCRASTNGWRNKIWTSSLRPCTRW